jgi:hypothetical protein
MTSMTFSIPTASLVHRMVFGGIDSHKDIHVAALLDRDGGLLGSASFPTTQAGFRRLQDWMGSAGTVARWGWRAPAATVLGSAGS